MKQPTQEVKAQFTQPVTQILIMLVLVALVGLGSYAVFGRVQGFFLANPILNGVILIVFVFGVLACFWQVLQLISSVKWIEAFVEKEKGDEIAAAPRLLATLSTLLSSRADKMQIGATSSRSILDSVAARIDEARDITRYIVNLLIFLGLLGTFYGLATTVPGLVETIQSLGSDGDGADGFSRLMSGLETQLGGMGTAFSSSLLGLAGSLLVGLLELFAGHGQNRFYRDLEEWLSSITRLGFSSGDSDGDGGEQGMVAGVLQHMSEQMDDMREIYAKSDINRAMVDDQLGSLAVSIERLTDRMARDNGTVDALERVADGQNALVHVMAEQAKEGGGQMDAESRMRLRSIDVQLLRMLEEMSAGRQEVTAELRGDLKALTKAIRSVTPKPASK